MNYDPKKFKKIKKRILKSYGLKPYKLSKRRKVRIINNVSGYAGLAYAVIMNAIKDYRRVKNHKVTEEQKLLSKEMGYKSPLTEIWNYFNGSEFLWHCAMCGIEPQELRKRYKI